MVRLLGTSPLGKDACPEWRYFREPVHRYIRFRFAKKDETFIAAGELLSAKLTA